MRAERVRLLALPARALVYASPALIGMVGISLLGSVVLGGARFLSWHFLVAAPERAGRAGGIGPIIVSTALLLLVQAVVVFPLAIGIGIFLAEISSRGRRANGIIRWALDVQAGIPSIVFGLFGNALFCEILGMGFSILAGGLTLACMVLPLTARAAEEGLRAVDPAQKLAAAALGFSPRAVVFRVLLPAAAPAVAVGMILGTTRALAETAALVFTSGYVARMPGSLLDSGRSLSLHILDLSMNVGGADGMAQASALVLVAGVGSLSLTTAALPALMRRLRGLHRRRTLRAQNISKETDS